MSRIDIFSIDSGCENQCVIRILKDGAEILKGTFLYYCTSSWLAKMSEYAAPYKLSGNTIYLNNALYWETAPPTGEHNVCQDGTCTRVPSPGVNECSTPGQKCASTTISDTGKQIVIIVIIIIIIYFFARGK